MSSSQKSSRKTLISNRISRRTMLQGVGAAMGLPLLDVMQVSASDLHTSDSGSLPRMAYVYFPNGVASGAWSPKKTGDDGELLKLNKWMRPLEKVRQHLILPENIWTPRGNGHGAGTATWLTGGGYDERRIDAGGVSVDQMVAKNLDDNTLLRSLELSVKGEGYFTGNLPRNCISWRDSRTPLSREIEPRAVFDRMFRTSDRLGIDRSVVDMVLSNAKQLKRLGSREDQRKLDEYLEAVRSIERRLKFADSQTQNAIRADELTDTLNRPQAGIPSDHREYVRLMFDMMVLAFWSGATRVSTFMMDHGQSNRYFDFIPGCKGTWHALSHYRDISGRTEDDDGKTAWDSVASKRDMYNRVTMWHHEQLAYFIEKMSSIREPDGSSLLDRTMICYGSSIADGNAHAERNLPMLLAGGRGLGWKTGRTLESRRRVSMSKLHLAMIQKMGVEIDRFGGTRSELDLG